MNKSFFDLFDFGGIFVSRKTCQSFFKHINSQRIVARNKHVYSKVIFKTVDEVRIVNILGN